MRDCALASSVLLALLAHNIGIFTLPEIITRLVECGKQGLGFVDTAGTKPTYRLQLRGQWYYWNASERFNHCPAVTGSRSHASQRDMSALAGIIEP